MPRTLAASALRPLLMALAVLFALAGVSAPAAAEPTAPGQVHVLQEQLPSYEAERPSCEQSPGTQAPAASSARTLSEHPAAPQRPWHPAQPALGTHEGAALPGRAPPSPDLSQLNVLRI